MSDSQSQYQGLQKRIEELENQTAFQDELFETLNRVVAQQDGEILALKHQLNSLAARLKDLGDATTGSELQDETPPHY